MLDFSHIKVIEYEKCFGPHKMDEIALFNCHKITEEEAIRCVRTGEYNENVLCIPKSQWISLFCGGKKKESVKMKPILFNTEMTRANNEGRKSVTRRIAFPAKDLRKFEKTGMPDAWWFRGRVYDSWDDAMKAVQGVMSHCEYHPGDILYIRETWAMASDILGGEAGPVYKADYTNKELEDLKSKHFRWHPSIHMPKNLARTFLRVTSVRIEPLKDIFKDPPGPNNQIVREGCRYGCDFIAVWENSIKKEDKPLYGYDANPWVWVIEYERCEKPE